MIRFLRRQGWVAGLFVLFVVLFVVTRIIQPGYGAGDFGSLVRAVLPYAFAVAAQTIVVIAGGIDLSVASMMALTSVTAASMMDGASEEYALFVVPFVLADGARARRAQRHPDRRHARARHRRHAGDAVRAAGCGAAGARRARRRRGRMAEGADRRHHFHPGRAGRHHAWIPKALVAADRLPRHHLDTAAGARGSACRSTPSAQRACRVPQRRAGRAHQDHRLCAGRACSPPWAG